VVDSPAEAVRIVTEAAAELARHEREATAEAAAEGAE